ncbi:GNAT family N-acetyltransferase [Rhizobium sp. 32-5/1]|uniref:GNAT family N-acetyltransferase n=1 Tax=Rhizobium sp. 32-5/1 TaxID=3019602 RepID=UPI00240DF2C5|nr:GNAT family N-acetyltransferase [Rhizobium sp. 32-5/1]WEZ84450.1 GNAT family N-acetyltransferase [Rhizobium sp. 32-5/1]
MSDISFTIRLATVEDAEAIHGGLMMIARHLGEEGRITATPADLRHHGFGDRPAFTVLIAEVGKDFAGMSLFFPSFSTWRGRPGAYIQDIVVDERFRGSGIGVALLRATAAHVRENGGCYLRLSVDAKNLSAQHFYERLGLEWSKDEHVHAVYGDAFDALAGQYESGV